MFGSADHYLNVLDLMKSSGADDLLGVFSAVINLPIVEKPVDRAVLAAA